MTKRGQTMTMRGQTMTMRGQTMTMSHPLLSRLLRQQNITHSDC